MTLTPNEIAWLEDCKAQGFDPVLEIQKLRDEAMFAQQTITDLTTALEKIATETMEYSTTRRAKIRIARAALSSARSVSTE